MNWTLNADGDEAHRDSLKFSKPGVSNDSSQYGCEVAEAAECMVDSSGEILVPFQVGEEVQCQHRCGQTHNQGQSMDTPGSKYNV